MSIVILDGGATFSDDAVYRYLLWRRISDSPRKLLFVMMNPSTATETLPDPTITRCAGFAARDGFGMFSVVNLWAYRATDPALLRFAADRIGPDNADHIREAVREHETIVCAWGAQVRKVPGWQVRVGGVLTLLRAHQHTLYCLGRCRDRKIPRHPLMVRADQPMERF
jgi:hypothetical protein